MQIGQTKCLKKESCLTLKRLVGSIWPTPCVFSKIVSSKERVKSCSFGTFDIITSHTFRENFIKISQVVPKIWRISLSIYFHRFSSIFWTFWHFLITNKLMTSLITDDVSIFHFQNTLNRLFNNCIKLYWS